jgi:hypothetical protein
MARPRPADAPETKVRGPRPGATLKNNTVGCQLTDEYRGKLRRIALTRFGAGYVTLGEWWRIGAS